MCGKGKPRNPDLEPLPTALGGRKAPAAFRNGQEEPGLLRLLGKQIQPLKVVDIITGLGDSDTLDPAMSEAQKVINAQ